MDKDLETAELIRQLDRALGWAVDEYLIDIPTYELCRSALWRNLDYCKQLLRERYAKRVDLDGCVPLLK